MAVRSNTGKRPWECLSKHPSVLLVEDEVLICDMVAEALTEQGFTVAAFADAREALGHLQSGSEIDILFTDINLPGDMDGGALARRARELRPGLPVMYTSGRYAGIEQFDPVAGSMFVPKPYDPNAIGRLLECLVGSSVLATAEAEDNSEKLHDFSDKIMRAL